MSEVTIDKILVAILGRALKAITDEMSLTMEKTTRSPILCEAKDFVTGLYDAEGRMLEQTENLPILSFSLSPVCEFIAKKFEGRVYPGDVFFHNDVFTLGNQNNDVAVFKPIFFGETLVAWSAAKGHMADIGGNVRGGYNLAAQGTDLELINVRVRSMGRTDKPELPEVAAGPADPEAALKGRRRAFVPETGAFEEVPVYDGHALPAGAALAGPALVERTDTTVFVSRGFTGAVDRLGSIVLRARTQEGPDA